MVLINPEILWASPEKQKGDEGCLSVPGIYDGVERSTSVKISAFDENGKVTAPGQCTIKHNGVVIHQDLALATTPGGGQANQKPGALFLQDHGDPVRFRNIWIIKK